MHISVSLYIKNALLLHSSWSFFILLFATLYLALHQRYQTHRNRASSFVYSCTNCPFYFWVLWNAIPFPSFYSRACIHVQTLMFCFNICHCRNLYRIFSIVNCFGLGWLLRQLKLLLLLNDIYHTRANKSYFPRLDVRSSKVVRNSNSTWIFICAKDSSNMKSRITVHY